MAYKIVSYYLKQLHNPSKCYSFLKYNGRWYEILDTKVDIDFIAGNIVMGNTTRYHRDVTDTYLVENTRPDYVRRYFIKLPDAPCMYKTGDVLIHVPSAGYNWVSQYVTPFKPVVVSGILLSGGHYYLNIKGLEDNLGFPCAAFDYEDDKK